MSAEDDDPCWPPLLDDCEVDAAAAGVALLLLAGVTGVAALAVENGLQEDGRWCCCMDCVRPNDLTRDRAARVRRDDAAALVAMLCVSVDRSGNMALRPRARRALSMTMEPAAAAAKIPAAQKRSGGS